MTFCPDESSPVADPTEGSSSVLGEAPSEIPTASEQEAFATSKPRHLEARPPNCS